MKALEAIVRELKHERARIDAALKALAILGTHSGSGRGGRRNLSATARARIAHAQRKRWAKWRTGKKRVP
jgi:hypothetical protein